MLSLHMIKKNDWWMDGPIGIRMVKTGQESSSLFSAAKLLGPLGDSVTGSQFCFMEGK